MNDTNLNFGYMDHKELDAWKLSVDLSVEVYALTNPFPKEELFGLVHQLRRAAVSVPSNIAEGCARASTKETIHFLYIALGSLAELETQLLISSRLGYVEYSEVLMGKISKVKQVILGLIRFLKNKD
ncbi:23S rRNA-intervening sequence protein [anaerobic digester metagenome]